MSPLFAFRFEATRARSVRDILLVFIATPTLDPEVFATVIETEIEKSLSPMRSC